MIRTALLVLATALFAACSQSSSPPSASAGDKPSTPTAAPASGQAGTATAPPPAEAATTAAPAASGGAAPSATPAPAPAPAPAPPPAPKIRELTIAADTPISVTLVSAIASDTSHVEDPVSGKVNKPIVVSGVTVVPAGAEVTGSVLEAKESGRVKGRATVVFQFDRLVVGGESHRIQTTPITREANPKKGDDAKKGAVGGGVGAIVGGIAGGGTGAVVGAAVGGTAAVPRDEGQGARVAPWHHGVHEATRAADGDRPGAGEMTPSVACRHE